MAKLETFIDIIYHKTYSLLSRKMILLNVEQRTFKISSTFKNTQNLEGSKAFYKLILLIYSVK